jgi:hypothetical protein
MVWVLPDMHASTREEGPIYRIGFSDRMTVLKNISNDGFLGRVNWRPPTLDEFDTLFAAEAFVGTKNFLVSTEYYWTSDSMVGGGPIVVSSGREVFDDARVRYLGIRRAKLMADKKEGYHIYELIQEQGRLLRKDQFSAQFVIVSIGAAEDIYYQQIACPQIV